MSMLDVAHTVRLWRFGTLAQLMLLGLLLSQLPVFTEDRPDPASVVVLAVLIVTCAAFLPLTPRLRRRARRYAAEHEDVLAPN